MIHCSRRFTGAALAVLLCPIAGQAENICHWETNDLGFSSAAARTGLNFIAAGLSNKGDVIANASVYSQQDYTYLYSNGELINLHALLPQPYQRSTAITISPGGKAVVGYVNNGVEHDERQSKAKAFWLYKDGSISFFKFDKVFKQYHKPSFYLTSVTDDGVVYGYMFDSIFQWTTVGSSNGVIQRLGDPAEPLVANDFPTAPGNHHGNMISAAPDSEDNPNYAMWKIGNNQKWNPVWDFPFKTGYRPLLVAENRTVLHVPFLISVPPEQYATVVEPKTGSESFLPSHTPGTGAPDWNSISPDGNYIAGSFTYFSTLTRSALYFKRQADGSWTRSEYVIDGNDTGAYAVNSRGDLLGYYRRTSGSGATFAIRDGVRTIFNDLGPGLKPYLTYAYLNAPGQVVIHAQDGNTDLTYPLLMTCVSGN